MARRAPARANARKAKPSSPSDRVELLNAILNTTVDGIVVIDDQGAIEVFNPGAERMFGYTESEVIGQNLALLMPSPDREQHDAYIERYLTTGEAKIIGVGREVTGRRRDGTVFPLHLAVGEVRVGGGRKFAGLMHDLTKRSDLRDALQNSEARWRAVIDSAVDGIVVIDARGCIETFNPAAERLFGHTQQEVLGRNVNMLMPSPYHEEHDGYLARYLETNRATIIGVGRDVLALRKDGTTFPVHLSVGQMTVRGEHKFTGILHDLSARMHMEEQLREQAALVRLGEMAALLAHEIKNPLAGIRGAIQVVGSRMPQDHPSVPVLKEIVARIDSLDEMMKDLLLFTRPQKPRLHPTPVSALVTATADLLRQDPALRDLDIDVSGSAPPVAADGEMLRIVFQNLLLNSAHAMEGKGTIRVAITASDGLCIVTFADSGPGIPGEVRQKIFVPFFTTKARGSGLGLPTAKRLIDAHEGEITVDCPPGGGTTVVVRLPIGAS